MARAAHSAKLRADTAPKPPQPAIAVAYSAGRDSTALLHATARAAREQGIEVVALHVHHGLMPEADAWLAFAEQQVTRWRRAGLPVRLVSTRLQSQPAKSDSVEAWARRERRIALAHMARQAGVGVVLLAHHRRDQAETVLLQALRGAGPAGLAAMPTAVERDGLMWMRPWLHMPREAIDAYVRRHRLRFVDDGSNRDPRYARSRLREAAWAALSQAFDDAETALASVARRAHEAHALMTEVAVSDLSHLVDDHGTLTVAHWRELTQARRVNALRAWLRLALDRGPPETLVERLLAELPHVRLARWSVDELREVALYRGHLSVKTVAAPTRARAPAGSPLAPSADATIDLSRPGVYALPAWGGAFEVTPVASGGVPRSLLKACRIAARHGGERWQAQPRSTPRSLKKQYQAADVAPWHRSGPLLYAAEQLLYVPGLGVDARVQTLAAPKRGTLLALHWRPDAAVVRNG